MPSQDSVGNILGEAKKAGDPAVTGFKLLRKNGESGGGGRF